MQFHWRVLNYISRCPSKRKEKNTKQKKQSHTHTHTLKIKSRTVAVTKHRTVAEIAVFTTHFLKLFSLARRQPWVAHINILQSICTLVSGWLCEVAVPGVDFAWTRRQPAWWLTDACPRYALHLKRALNMFIQKNGIIIKRQEHVRLASASRN